MTNLTMIRLLKSIMLIGISLIILGVYLHNYNDTIESMGVTGIIISACCVAVGMILSLPTKMYLTFIWVTQERKKRQLK